MYKFSLNCPLENIKTILPQAIQWKQCFELPASERIGKEVTSKYMKKFWASYENPTFLRAFEENFDALTRVEVLTAFYPPFHFYHLDTVNLLLEGERPGSEYLTACSAGQFWLGWSWSICSQPTSSSQFWYGAFKQSRKQSRLGARFSNSNMQSAPTACLRHIWRQTTSEFWLATSQYHIF